MIEEVRSWLIQQEIGLLTETDLISLVDERIQSLSSPPEYLIKVSMRENLNFIPRLDLIQNPVKTQDCIVIAQKIIDAINLDVISYNEVETLSINICKLLDSKEPAYDWFDWISDEIHLMNEGIKEQNKSKEGISKALKEITLF